MEGHPNNIPRKMMRKIQRKEKKVRNAAFHSKNRYFHPNQISLVLSWTAFTSPSRRIWV